MSGPDDWEAKVAEYDDLVSKLSDATTLEDRDRLAWALVSRGHALRELGRAREALASFEEVVARFDGSSEVELQVRVASALGRSADALLELKRPEEALAVCDARLSRFAGNADPRFLPSTAFAMRLRARVLLKLGRAWEAAEAYQQYLRDFSPPEPSVFFGLARSPSSTSSGALRNPSSVRFSPARRCGGLRSWRRRGRPQRSSPRWPRSRSCAARASDCS